MTITEYADYTRFLARFVDPILNLELLGKLASQFRQVAEAMPTAPDFLITTLIPALASRIGTSSRLAISETAGYTVASIFRTIIVAKTG
ncbi:MAG: hypothetical protein AAF050_24040, partial [Cyanobacteria bacterium J06649_5]